MNEKPFTACVLTSADRAKSIAEAQTRIVFCGPGITPDECAALIAAQQRLRADAVRVLVDFTTTAFRLGYWGDQSPSDIARLAECMAHAEIADGLRLGLLIVDNEGYIFVSAAASLEKEQAAVQEPNALRLSLRETDQLLTSISTTSQEKHLDRPKLTVEATKAVAQQAIERNMLKPAENRLLDLLRERISIVQFEVHGYQLSRRSLSLPSEIITALGSQDRDITDRITASWRVFRPGNTDHAEVDKLQKEVNEGLLALKNKHLKQLSHYGFGLVRDEQANFDAAWQAFQQETVAGYAKALLATVDSLVKDSRTLLKRLLEERAGLGQLPIPHAPTLFPKPAEVERDNYIEWLLDRVRWPSASEVSSGVVIKKRHYDLTPELLHDEEFVRELEKAFGEDFVEIRKSVEARPGSGANAKSSFSL